MRYTQANLNRKSAKLADEFGWSFACRRFGEDAMNEVAELLPHYISGKNKGKVKGRIVWWKALSNGYAPIVSTGVRAGSICRIQLHLGVGDDDSSFIFGDARMNYAGTLDIKGLKQFQAAVENGRIPVSKIF